MLSIKFIVLCSNKWIDISVPCRGTTFLNHFLKSGGRYYGVSVPCRGTTFLICFRSVPKKIIAGRVSVPCRGTTFLINPFGSLIKDADQGFRPLSGNYIFHCYPFEVPPEYNLLFPSPVGELHFSLIILLFHCSGVS